MIEFANYDTTNGQAVQRREGVQHLMAKSRQKPKSAEVCDGKKLREMMAGSVAWLDKSAADVDAINVFPVPDGETQASMFEKFAWEGLQKRLDQAKTEKRQVDEEKYRTRLDYEIGIIKKKDLPGYFLILSDYINWAKKNGIPVGPGRGSVVGSLVAYCLSVTDVDPIEWGLLFERFLNIGHKWLPEITVDFCCESQSRIVQYIKEKYGESHVARIVSIKCMKTKAAIRNAGRALAMPRKEVAAIAGMIPVRPRVNLKDALETESRLISEVQEKPHIQKLISSALFLENLPCNPVIRDDIIVISDEKPLSQHLPLFSFGDGETVTQFERYIGIMGLVTFYIQTLPALTIIANTLKLIKEHGKTQPDMENIDLNDADTYRLFQRGETKRIFPLESAGMKKILVRIKPESFNHIMAAVALNRPGPLGSGMVDQYIKGRHGRVMITYLLPELESILNETYGVLLYQEQFMLIAVALANFSLNEADDMRKALGKKISEEISCQKEKFLSGAIANGIKDFVAETIFDHIYQNSEYSFNKSHCVAYSLITYQTAFLKTHYPTEFMAALSFMKGKNVAKQ